jgi:quinoprotein glucose dehydrogenase
VGNPKLEPIMILRVLLPLLPLIFAAPAVTASPVPAGDWRAYGRTPQGDRHSPLTAITQDNVARLAVAWRYHTGELGPAYQARRPARLSATPLAIGGRLFFSTPYGKVIALDGATGREIWKYDGRVDGRAGFGDFVSRGVSWWSDSAARQGTRCASRILAGMVDGRLIALDAADGRPCKGFGRNGVVDLRIGLRNAPDELSEYELTSPPAVIGDVVVVGSAVADNNRLDAASGEVRGFDARSGRLLWNWDPVPQDARDPAYASWQGAIARRTGGANSWSVIAADPGTGLVFLPTSSPSVDYWGGARLGDNSYANSVVALNAADGKMVWHFQTVHHDLWDYDNAAPPALIDVVVGGRPVPAVVQATKSGQLFVLDRLTGKPLFPVEERPVPASDAQGEKASPTQPFSSLPPLSPMSLTPADLAGLPEPLRAQCLAALAGLRNDGPFTPPSEGGSLIMPSNIGGAHWGGVAFDPALQAVIVPTNRIAAVVTLIPRAAAEAARAHDTGGERLGLEYARMHGSPYILRREFFSVGDVPCTPAPFGSLHAISLLTGQTLWNVPLGTAAEGAVKGMVNLGGPISTASGLLFIGAAPDAYLRAFSTASGAELWKGKLPAGARSTPMTYAAGGQQYVAVAAGGDGELFGQADEIVAFALPQ